MNASNAKDYLPLVQALAEGRTIQVYFEFDEVWCDIAELRFDASASQYRIKPEPREVWFNRYEHDVTHGPYASREEAENYAGNFATQVRYREVIE